MSRTRQRRGMSIMELTITSALFIILTTVLVSGLLRGIRSWRLIDDRSTLANTAQKVFWEIGRELESSDSASSLLIDTPLPAYSFASPFGLLGTPQSNSFEVDPVTGSAKWRKYVIYYLHEASGELRRREIPIPSGNGARTLPTPLNQADLGSGLQPLEFYATGGAEVIPSVKTFRVERLSQTIQIVLEIQTEKGRRASYLRAFRPRS